MLSIGKTLTPEQRLSKAVVDIMAKCHALAGIVMIGNREVVFNDLKVQTACTNGKNEWYSAEFMGYRPAACQHLNGSRHQHQDHGRVWSRWLG